MSGIDIDRTPPLLNVTIARGRANAIDAATSRELSAVFTRFRDDDQLRIAIVTGRVSGSSAPDGTWTPPRRARLTTPTSAPEVSGGMPSCPICASR